MTLAEFLLARIKEDQHFGTHDRHLAKRWDAECETKRRIVEECKRALDEYDAADRGSPNMHGPEFWDTTHAADPDLVLRLLALPYADHPDYDPEWTP